MNNSISLPFIITTKSINMKHYQRNEHATAMIGRRISGFASQIIVLRGGIET
jgi:hypothetical protein